MAIAQLYLIGKEEFLRIRTKDLKEVIAEHKAKLEATQEDVEDDVKFLTEKIEARQGPQEPATSSKAKAKPKPRLLLEIVIHTKNHESEVEASQA